MAAAAHREQQEWEEEGGGRPDWEGRLTGGSDKKIANLFEAAILRPFGIREIYQPHYTLQSTNNAFVGRNDRAYANVSEGEWGRNRL